jgi:hypothetical protein
MKKSKTKKELVLIADVNHTLLLIGQSIDDLLDTMKKDMEFNLENIPNSHGPLAIQQVLISMLQPLVSSIYIATEQVDDEIERLTNE